MNGKNKFKNTGTQSIISGHCLKKKVKKWKEKVAKGPCMMQSAQNVVHHARFPLSRLKEGQFTAGTAINQKGDSRVIETLIWNASIIFLVFQMHLSDFFNRARNTNAGT